MNNNALSVYLGSYAENVSIWGYNSDDRNLTFKNSFPSSKGPSWIISSLNKGFVFAVMELEKKLVSFSTESETLVKLSESSSFGDYPCFIAIDPEGKFILVANFGSGDQGVLASFSLDENGIIENTAIITHYPSPGEKSHIHCAEIFRSNHGPAYAAVVDLGMNTVSQYLITPLVGISSDTTPTTVITFPSGSGPRQIKFHPILPIAIVILELANALVVVPLDRDTGILKQPADFSATISTLREGDDPTHMSSAEVVISPLSSGYASNRDCTAAMANHELGHTSRMYRSTVAVFKIIPDGYESYKLQLLQHVSACGDFPRYIQLVRDGAELVLVNQIDSNFVSFLVDSTTGCIREDSAVITTHENLRHPTHTLFL